MDNSWRFPSPAPVLARSRMIWAPTTTLTYPFFEEQVSSPINEVSQRAQDSYLGVPIRATEVANRSRALYSTAESVWKWGRAVGSQRITRAPLELPAPDVDLNEIQSLGRKQFGSDGVLDEVEISAMDRVLPALSLSLAFNLLPPTSSVEPGAMFVRGVPSLRVEIPTTDPGSQSDSTSSEGFNSSDSTSSLNDSNTSFGGSVDSFECASGSGDLGKRRFIFDPFGEDDGPRNSPTAMAPVSLSGDALNVTIQRPIISQRSTNKSLTGLARLRAKAPRAFDLSLKKPDAPPSTPRLPLIIEAGGITGEYLATIDRFLEIPTIPDSTFEMLPYAPPPTGFGGVKLRAIVADEDTEDEEAQTYYTAQSQLSMGSTPVGVPAAVVDEDHLSNFPGVNDDNLPTAPVFNFPVIVPTPVHRASMPYIVQEPLYRYVHGAPLTANRMNLLSILNGPLAG